ncbi:hypothetical protein B5X24_HaOG211755 [Helicoverpa armigera]|uniref:RING-type domain-containing protein n=1 Tax=Helicoverpa armigera TaxID=29058 RepID=A0A2W1BCQ4_HELAM|nr:hypothetical protein B5X24_HaOG211755 [Helicoverpa armigera]
MDEGLLNDLLECSVCLERLDTSSRVLPCQHTFCLKCLKEWLFLLRDNRISQGAPMSRMQGLGGSEGGGAASKCPPHEDPRGHEELRPEENGNWTTDFEKRWTFTVYNVT